MYEEEECDLVTRHRRLRAHLQTQNTEFNRRLNLYLAGELAQKTPKYWQSPHLDNVEQFMHPGKIGLLPQVTGGPAFPYTQMSYPVAEAPHGNPRKSRDWPLTDADECFLTNKKHASYDHDSPSKSTKLENWSESASSSGGMGILRSQSGRLASTNKFPTCRVAYCYSAPKISSQGDNLQQPFPPDRNQPKNTYQPPQSQITGTVKPSQRPTKPFFEDLSTKVQLPLAGNMANGSCNNVMPSTAVPQKDLIAYSYNPNESAIFMSIAPAQQSGALQFNKVYPDQIFEGNSSIESPTARDGSVSTPMRSGYSAMGFNDKDTFGWLKEPTPSDSSRATSALGEVDWREFLSDDALEEHLGF